MEEASEVGNYLPFSFKTRSEQDYKGLTSLMRAAYINILSTSSSVS